MFSIDGVFVVLMAAKKDLWIIILSSVAFFILLNLLTSYFFELPFSYILLVGKSSYGTVQLIINSQNGSITIYSPVNDSYGFDIGDPYNISLNVSADFEATSWNYSLYDLRHGSWVYQDVGFTPNTTFLAVRWDNRLDVVATDGASKYAAASVTFFVSVPNSAPIIGRLDNPILVCENTQLDYKFNATDVDEDDLEGSLNQTNPFFIDDGAQISDKPNTTTFTLFTGAILDYDNVGNHSRIVYVSDGSSEICCTDYTDAHISVIEVNDEPVAENIPTQTVYFNGTGKSFVHQWNVTDEEDGTSSDENLTFNISFSVGSLFLINETTGLMNYTPYPWDEGAYTVTVCATDQALLDIHPNISVCTGQQATSNFVCDNFTLIVTDQNRAPNITDYYPLNLSFSVLGNTIFRFNASAVDPDGANPDIYWYVEGSQSQYNEGVNFSSFQYTFDCDFAGTRTILVNATDGDLDDSVTWTVEVLYDGCPPGGDQEPPPSGGGGGGGGGAGGDNCYENWICQGWSVCRNVEDFFVSGNLGLEDYTYLGEVCIQNQYLGRSCGYQEETCFDLSSCNNVIPKILKPSNKRSCYYTPDPSCFDEILNCHDGGCEVLTDCGGPCPACPTCTDGIRNQGESGIDCGGPCPFVCPYEEPKIKISFFWLWLLLLLLIILLFIIYKVLKLLGYFPTDDEKERKLERRAMRKLKRRNDGTELMFFKR